MSKRKSAMKKAIVLVLGGVALYIIIVVVANLHLIAWWHSDQWTGTKSFADGWTANLIIYVATIPPDNQPTVQIDLRAAPI